jgi:hypothetical protein
MQIFVERLLLELAAIALQLALLGLFRWLRPRPVLGAALVDAM